MSTRALKQDDDAPGIAHTDTPPRDFGKKPNMCWLPKKSLKIDKRYQRQLTSRRSKQLIEKLRDNFCWTHCGPLVVTDNGDGTYSIVDGQHRWKAASELAEVTLLPCMVHDALSLQEQAHAFVAHNADRVTVNPLAIFHAQVVAGDQMAGDIMRACETAGVSIVRAHATMNALGPTETVALGVLREIYRSYEDPEAGKLAITGALQMITEAYPEKNGQLTSGMIRAVWQLLSEGATYADLVAAMRKTDDKALNLAAITAVQANPALKIRDAYREALADEMTAPAGVTGDTAQCLTLGCTTTRQPGAMHCAQCVSRIRASQTAAKPVCDVPRAKNACSTPGCDFTRQPGRDLCAKCIQAKTRPVGGQPNQIHHCAGTHCVAQVSRDGLLCDSCAGKLRKEAGSRGRAA